MPPTFDFSGSSNLKAAHVLYPGPESLDEAGAQAFGYTNDVVFPILVAPLDPDMPVTLRVAFGYAVCHDICLPVRADLGLRLDGKPSADADRVAAAMAAVPRLSRLGEGGPLPRIQSVIPAVGPDGGFTVEAVTPADGGTLFVEAPEGWSYATMPPIPSGPVLPGSGAADARRLSFPVKRLDAPAGQPRPTAPVTLTLVTSSGAVEVPVDLGRAAPSP